MGLLSPIFTYESSARSDKSHYFDFSQEKRVLVLLTKVKEQEDWRRDAQNLYEQMKKHSINSGGEISARHMKKLRDLISTYTEIITPSIEQYQASVINFLNPDNVISIDHNQDSSINFNFSRYVRAKELRAGRYRKTVTKVTINPTDNEGAVILDDMLFQVALRVMALENFSLGIIPFMNESRFRYVLIRDLDSNDSREVEKLWHNFINTLYKSDNLRDLVEILNENQDKIELNNKINRSLYTLINRSEVGYYIKKKANRFTFFEEMMSVMKQMSERHWDTFKKIGTTTLYYASKVFGNTVGLVQSRRGYLFNMSVEEENRIAQKMKPLDVIFEKTPFRLTDRFIPGHFGHNAIWSGNEEELKELGVWDKLPHIYMDAVEKYNYKGISFQSDIRAGARIIEALRPGVEINTLRHFLDIDDFAVMRADECEQWKKGSTFCLTPKLKKEYLIMAFSQIGKDYDFAFDVNTEETIVCSELLYRTYLDIDFQTTYTVGSYNISPDQVAYQGDEEGDIFTPVILYHEGEEVKGNIRSLFYDLLHSEELMKLKNEALKHPERANK